jgi:hypothetical protein
MFGNVEDIVTLTVNQSLVGDQSNLLLIVFSYYDKNLQNLRELIAIFKL